MDLAGPLSCTTGCLLTLAAASVQIIDGPSTSAVPAAVADPALAAGPLPAETPMLPAVPLLVPPDCSWHYSVLCFVLTLPGKQSFMCMPTLHQSSGTPSKVSSGQSPSQMVSQMVSSLPRVQGSPATSARLHLAPSSAAEGLGIPLPVASLPCADVPDAASPLAGKKRGPESMSDAESSDTAEAPTFFLFFFFLLGGRDIHYTKQR